MSCTRPLKAYWADQYRTRITFDAVQSRTKVPFGLPCGKCIGCRMDYAAQWGMRCVHEAKLWPSNYFVTLTYSDEFLPDGGSLSVRDCQLFMKRLRKKFRNRGAEWTNPLNGKKEKPIRFFLGAEYGEENMRPHYHLLLFNIVFRDLRFLSYNKRGEPWYTSKELSDCWFQGHSSVGALTFDSAVYCAKYAIKKLSVSDKSPPEIVARYDERYKVYDEDGVCYDREVEFACRSNRPGIGRAYYDKYGSELRVHDSVIVDGREVRPARYYDVLTVSADPGRSAEIKSGRKRSAVLNRADNTPERLRVKERLMEIAAEKKERKL